MRRKLIAGNWKMNGSVPFINDFAAEISSFSKEFAAADVLVFPPCLFLCHTNAVMGGISVGAQNVSGYQDGAYTGEVSASMLVGVGCRWALIGHSERRMLFAESDEVVLGKVSLALSEGLQVILCVGETLAERTNGQVREVVSRQLSAVLGSFSVAELASVVVAYEPVWAIGTGQTASPKQVQEVHALIRGLIAEKDAELSLSMRIIYGGSVKPENAVEIFSMPDVDGGLVGGASLLVTDFVSIVKAAI